jgi:hypothetical protein
MTTRILNGGTQGSLYQTELSATGGVPQYTWSVSSGEVPNGLTLSPSGLLSGYPTGSGTFSFTVSVSDSATPTPAEATGSVSLTVAPETPLTVTPAYVVGGTQGVAYSAYFESTGGIGPYSFSISSGSLPSGLSLSSEGNGGYLFGTPTVSGSFEFTVEATDSATPSPDVASVNATVVIAASPPLTVTTTAVPTGQQGVAYSQTDVGYADCYGTTLQATGGISPYAWSLASGSLPIGLTLDADGSICGTPTAAGTFHFTAEVTDSASPTPDGIDVVDRRSGASGHHHNFAGFWGPGGVHVDAAAGDRGCGLRHVGAELRLVAARANPGPGWLPLWDTDSGRYLDLQR